MNDMHTMYSVHSSYMQYFVCYRQQQQQHPGPGMPPFSEPPPPHMPGGPRPGGPGANVRQNLFNK